VISSTVNKAGCYKPNIASMSGGSSEKSPRQMTGQGCEAVCWSGPTCQSDRIGTHV